MIAASATAVLVLASAAVYEAAAYHERIAPPPSVSVARALGRFDVDPSRFKSGTPNFRGTDTARAADGSGSTGLWAGDGPSTFEWHFASDVMIHLLERRVQVEHLGRHVTLTRATPPPSTSARAPSGTCRNMRRKCSCCTSRGGW